MSEDNYLDLLLLLEIIKLMSIELIRVKHSTGCCAAGA
jgi:hypothetical protein